MYIRLFLRGFILGLLVGTLPGYCLLHKPQRRTGRQREIDHLAEWFQALFRQINQGKGI